MPEIVKVQRPISPSDAPLLVYGHWGDNKKLMAQTEEIVAKMGDAMKAYFHATWTGKTWCIRDRAPDQEW